MRSKQIFGDAELAFLRELVRQNVPFLIVGLSAAALQGAPVVTQDVDLWFKDLDHPGLRRALRRVGGTYVPPVELHPPALAGKGLELFDVVLHMHGLEAFDREWQRAVWLSLGAFKVPVLPLERILRSKRALNRAKDRLVLRVLGDALLAVKRRGAKGKA